VTARAVIVQRPAAIVRRSGRIYAEVLRQIWNDDRGQDIAEYAMMLAVILLIVTATVSSIGTNANTVFGNAANKLTTA